mgnify:CR=1 FL=1
MKRLAIFSFLMAQYFLMSWAVEMWVADEVRSYTVYCTEDLSSVCETLSQSEDLPLEQVVYAAGMVLSYDKLALQRPEGKAFLSALDVYQNRFRQESRDVYQERGEQRKISEKEFNLRQKAKDLLKLVGTVDI